MGVTPHQGERESRLQGKGLQVSRILDNQRTREMRLAQNYDKVGHRNVKVRLTGEPGDTETVKPGLAGGGWKSAVV